MPKVAWTIPTVPMGAAVPRILHQHFLSGDEALPAAVRRVRDQLREANPIWTYRFWDASRAEAFIRREYGEGVLQRYLRIRPEYYAARSDLLRYLAMYVQGGVYLDIKSTCDRPLDEAILPEDRYLLLHFPHMMKDVRTEETSQAFAEHFPELQHLEHGEYAQWVIACVPGHPYLKAVIERVLRNLDRYTPFTHGTGVVGTLRVTGPIAYSLAIHQIRDLYPHSGPMSAARRGFLYSGLDSMESHKKIYPGQMHYGKLSAPLMQASPLTDRLTRAMHWSSRLPLIGSAWGRIQAPRSGRS